MLRTVFRGASGQVPWTINIRSTHSEVKIPVPWGHIAGKWWNKDQGQPILALHGWQDNANSFDCIVPRLTSKLSVLAIDLPGHGASSHFPKGISYHRMSSVVVLKRIVDYFGWKKVSLMGHSFGGQTCFLYAAMYPEQVDALVTLDILVPIPLDEKRLMEKGGQIIDDFIRRDSQDVKNAPIYSFDKLVDMMKNSKVAPVTEEAARILLQRGSKRVGEGKYQLTRDPRIKGYATSGWSSRELLEFCCALHTNILCIKAKSAPYFCSKEFFDESWAQISKVAKYANLRYEEGGHHIHLENAEVISPIIDEFFYRVFQ